MQEVSIFHLFTIPGLTKPALACPVLDTGYLIRGNPVFLSCILAGVYPVLDTTLRYSVLSRTPERSGWCGSLHLRCKHADKLKK
jgi:hypothetical protein